MRALAARNDALIFFDHIYKLAEKDEFFRKISVEFFGRLIICDRKGLNSSIHMYNRFEAICDKCRTRYEVVNSAGFPANSSQTDCPLIGYNCYEEGEVLHIFSNDLYRDKNINSYYPVPRRRK